MIQHIVSELQKLTEAWRAKFDNPPDLPLIWNIHDVRLLYLDDVFVTAADHVDLENTCFDVELWHIPLTNGGCVDVEINWPYEGDATFKVVTDWGEIQVMDVKSMGTEDLEAFLAEQMKDENEDFRMLDCLAAMGELKARKGELETPEQRLQWKMTVEYYFPWSLRDDEDLTDPGTGMVLRPSWHGEDCPGNGEQGECCCDECDHYLACFPENRPGKIWDEDNQRYI